MAHDPLIVFGAFDRHNFGDLLFGHLAAALFPDHVIFHAGVAARDMRACGGHLVQALPQLAARMRERPLRILHAGGEVLSCSAWEAAVMLQPPAQAKRTIARYDDDAMAQARWAQRVLGVADLAPYVMDRRLFPQALSVAYNAVGGVDLAFRDPALRADVLDKLRQADALAVRDRCTLAILREHGIAAHLLPDPAVMVDELFSGTIRRHANQGEPNRVRAAFPRGYLAVQFSADFGRDDILDGMARQLARYAAAHGCGIVLFRAGVAPWHDELAAYRRLAARVPAVPVRIFHSLDIWDICALIAYSSGYCGSSLHGRIVALALGLPRLNLRHPDQPPDLPTKQEAFVESWEDDTLPGVACIDTLEQSLHAAMSADPEQLRAKAASLIAHYRQGFALLRKRFTAID